jgi:hypothetical protein
MLYPESNKHILNYVHVERMYKTFCYGNSSDKTVVFSRNEWLPSGTKIQTYKKVLCLQSFQLDTSIYYA